MKHSLVVRSWWLLNAGKNRMKNSFVRARLYIRDELQGKQKIIECVTRGSVSRRVCRVALILIQLSCGSHSHTAVGLFSFPYSCQAVLIPIVGRFSFALACRATLILIVGRLSFCIVQDGLPRAIQGRTAGRDALALGSLSSWHTSPSPLSLSRVELQGGLHGLSRLRASRAVLWPMAH